MKDNIDYYQHYANADQHPKFKMLRVTYGWAGEGRFWALNNRIAQAENCCLDISKKYNAASIASDLGLSLQEFEEYIHCLKNDCELVRECSPGVITTDIIQENFKSVTVNREKARERKKRYVEKVLQGSPELSKSSPDQNKKVKESKVKESKEDNNGVPVDAIIEIYHKTLPALPKIRVKDKIAKTIKARWHEQKDRQCLEWWERLFTDEIATSPFLMGQVKDWQANLKWIVSPENMDKILNGQYRKNKPTEPVKEYMTGWTKN